MYCLYFLVSHLQTSHLLYHWDSITKSHWFHPRRRMLWLHALQFYDYFNECQQVYKTKHRDYACIADLGYTTYV